MSTATKQTTFVPSPSEADDINVVCSITSEADDINGVYFVAPNEELCPQTPNLLGMDSP